MRFVPISSGGSRAPRACKYMYFMCFLAARRGLEPPTSGLGNHCSILLSYRAAPGVDSPIGGR